MACVFCGWVKRARCTPGFTRAASGERQEYRDLWERESEGERLRQADALLKEDPARAIAEFAALANGGSTWAMVQLGVSLQNGIGGTMDLSAAEAWLIRASELGGSLAFRYLAWHYRGRRDHAAEKAVLERGVVVGDLRSIYMLGRLHLDGPPKYRDLATARVLLERSDALGNLYARRDLGWLLLSGRCGVRGILHGIYLAADSFRRMWRICMAVSQEDEASGSRSERTLISR